MVTQKRRCAIVDTRVAVSSTHSSSYSIHAHSYQILLGGPRRGGCRLVPGKRHTGQRELQSISHFEVNGLEPSQSSYVRNPLLPKSLRNERMTRGGEGTTVMRLPTTVGKQDDRDALEKRYSIPC